MRKLIALVLFLLVSSANAQVITLANTVLDQTRTDRWHLEQGSAIFTFNSGSSPRLSAAGLTVLPSAVQREFIVIVTNSQEAVILVRRGSLQVQAQNQLWTIGPDQVLWQQGSVSRLMPWAALPAQYLAQIQNLDNLAVAQVLAELPETAAGQTQIQDPRIPARPSLISAQLDPGARGGCQGSSC